MLYAHFKALANNPELRHLILDGACIGKRKIDGFHVLLFQTINLYYEVVFDNDSSSILTYWYFEDVDGLEPYLKKIKLPELI